MLHSRVFRAKAGFPSNNITNRRQQVVFPHRRAVDSITGNVPKEDDWGV